MEEGKILNLINERIRAGLQVHTNAILKRTTEKINDKFEENIEEVKDELIGLAQQIFENMEFLTRFKSEINRTIKHEIATQLSTKGLQNIIRKVTANITKSQFVGIIEEVIQKTTERMSKRLRTEYRIAKELCYSIDSEIKHTLMDSPISAQSEEMIKEHMTATINKVAEQQLLQIDKGMKKLSWKD